MILNKWNYETQEYEPFESPVKHRHVYSEDMDELVACANCGETLPYGDTFTSRTIHTSMGFGYPVCDRCYREEFNDEAKSKV